MISYNDDVLREVLLRLPAKSLIRFKLVCKHWFSLISSHEFSHLHSMHHLLSKSKPSFLLRHPEKSQYFHLQCSLQENAKLVPYDFPPTLCNPKIRSVSNGLFLLVENGSEEEQCYVYNPTTRQSRKIVIYSNRRYINVIGLNIAYDPSKSPHYRIICVRAVKMSKSSRLWMPKERLCKIVVYDSSTNTWEHCGEAFSAPSHLDFNFGVYWDNGIHWRGRFLDLDDGYVETYPAVVYPYPLPDTWGRITEKYYIMSNGYLHCIAHCPKMEWLMVFELQEDYSQWSLKYSINLGSDSGLVSVLSFIRGDNEEDSMLLFYQPGKLMAYRFADKSVKELIDLKEENFYEESVPPLVSRSTFQFFETLVPLD